MQSSNTSLAETPNPPPGDPPLHGKHVEGVRRLLGVDVEPHMPLLAHVCCSVSGMSAHIDCSSGRDA